jgi:cytochrome b involved in lipid metabolism
MKHIVPVAIILIFFGAAYIILRPATPVVPVQKRAVSPTAVQEVREKTYVLADVATHATAQDCWLAIDGGVYDVTAFIQGKQHPGGEAILRGCGKDASTMFGRHSERARAMLPDYKIGIVSQ